MPRSLSCFAVLLVSVLLWLPVLVAGLLVSVLLWLPVLAWAVLLVFCSVSLALVLWVLVVRGYLPFSVVVACSVLACFDPLSGFCSVLLAFVPWVLVVYGTGFTSIWSAGTFL